MGGQDGQRLAAARHGQQVPGLAPAGADEGDVLADQRRVDRDGAGGEVGDPGPVERFGPAEDSRTPCGTTATPRPRSSATPRGGTAGTGANDSAMTSQNRSPGSSPTTPAISGRHPTPTPPRSGVASLAG